MYLKFLFLLIQRKPQSDKNEHFPRVGVIHRQQVKNGLASMEARGQSALLDRKKNVKKNNKEYQEKWAKTGKKTERKEKIGEGFSALSLLTGMAGYATDF